MTAEFFLANRPLWGVLISMAAAGLILLNDRRPLIRESITMLAAAGKFIIVLSMLPEVLAGKLVETVPWTAAAGISLHFKADPLGLLFALLSSGLWIVTSVYNIGYMRAMRYGHETGYYAAFALCLSATMGIAFAANLLTFFIFYEILTIATYPLVIHARTDEAVAGGRKYLVYTLAAGQLLLLAIVGVQIMVPEAEFTPGGFLAGQAPPALLGVLFILFMAGVGVKSAIMPLHGWLPTAMVAPTPVSALLHAVAVVKAGAFGVLRVVGYVFGPELINSTASGKILVGFAAATIILASLRALAEDNLKRRLAYSTVGQLSYIVLGAGLATPLAFLGGIMHIVAHAFMKITLFFCAGAVYATAHKERVSEIGGTGKEMPVTMAAFLLGSLGIAGIPFFAGFVSKWNLGLGALEAGNIFVILVLIASALLSTGYLLPVAIQAFFGRSSGTHHGGEAKPSLLYPLVITACISIILGVFPNIGLKFYELALAAVQSVFGATSSIAMGGQ
ncbi:MAG TPA: cation:proton antiporter [Peptococcaceae bacterium]|nr:cation:proton antiporter [Peptococcaceae bacterium]